jgi:ribosome recycling factor
MSNDNYGYIYMGDTIDIRSGVVQKTLLTIQEAITQGNIPVGVNNINFLISLIKPEFTEDTSREMLKAYQEKLSELYSNFRNPSVDVSNEISMDMQSAMIEHERMKTAREIYTYINNIVELLIENGGGVLG